VKFYFAWVRPTVAVIVSPVDRPRKLRKHYRPSTSSLQVDEVCRLLWANRGRCNKVAEILGISPSVLCYFIGKHPICARVLRDIEMDLRERARGGLSDLVDDREWRAIQYVLDKSEREAAREAEVYVPPVINILPIRSGTHLSLDEIRRLVEGRPLEQSASDLVHTVTAPDPDRTK
jgi:hypothetical protein